MPITVVAPVEAIPVVTVRGVPVAVGAVMTRVVGKRVSRVSSVP